MPNKISGSPSSDINFIIEEVNKPKGAPKTHSKKKAGFKEEGVVTDLIQKWEELTRAEKESPKPSKAKQFKSPGKEENLKETTKTKRVSQNIIEPSLEVKIEDSITKGEKPETEESLDSGSMTPSSTETPPSTSQISQEKVKDLKGKKKISEERKVQRQKEIKFVKSSKMNDKLLNYKNLIEKLNDEKFEKKPRKLVRKNGGIIEKAKHRTAIGDLLDKYIKSSRSKQTREPVVVIFKDIHKAMDAGYTHFKFRQEMYGVIETKSMELKELTQEFLKTKYVRSVVKDFLPLLNEWLDMI